MPDTPKGKGRTASRGGRQRAPGAGRPRKPTALKLLEGTYRPDRANPREPKVAVLRRLTPPTWLRHLGDQGIAVKFWQRNVPKLVSAGILAETDVEAFAMVCEIYSTYRRSASARPKSFRQRKGHSDPLAQWNKALNQLHRALMSFGLNPAARSKVIAGGDIDLPVPAGAQQASPAGGRDEAWLRTYGAAAPG